MNSFAVNSEKYWEYPEFDVEIAEFCPKFANLLERQGINRDSVENSLAPASAANENGLGAGMQKKIRDPSGTFVPKMKRVT